MEELPSLLTLISQYPETFSFWGIGLAFGLGGKLLKLPEGSKFSQRFTLAILILITALSISNEGLKLLSFQGLAILAHTYLLVGLKDEWQKQDSLSPAFLTFGLGAAYMITQSDWLGFIIGAEILTLCSLWIAGNFGKHHQAESLLKYYLLGATAIACTLYGQSIIQSSTTISIPTIDIEANGENSFYYLGQLLFLAYPLFKLTLSPFHSWAIDTYSKNNYLFIGFSSTLVKLPVLVFLLKHLNENTTQFESLKTLLLPVFALSLLWGSFGALQPKSIKRFIAWSGIAQASFLAFFLLNPSTIVQSEIWYYALAYLVAQYLLIETLSKYSLPEELKNWQSFPIDNLGFFALVIALSNLAGVPPLIGFFAKLKLFPTLVSFAHWAWIVLVIVAILLGYYFYLNIALKAYQANWRNKTLKTTSDMWPLYALLVLNLLLGFISL